MDTLYLVSENTWLPGAYGVGLAKTGRKEREVWSIRRAKTEELSSANPTKDTSYPWPVSEPTQSFAMALPLITLGLAGNSGLADCRPPTIYSITLLTSSYLIQKQYVKHCRQILDTYLILYLHHFPPILKPFLKSRSSSRTRQTQSTKSVRSSLRFNSVWCHHSRSDLLEYGSPRQF